MARVTKRELERLLEWTNSALASLEARGVKVPRLEIYHAYGKTKIQYEGGHALGSICHLGTMGEAYLALDGFGKALDLFYDVPVSQSAKPETEIVEDGSGKVVSVRTTLTIEIEVDADDVDDVDDALEEVVQELGSGAQNWTTDGGSEVSINSAWR